MYLKVNNKYYYINNKIFRLKNFWYLILNVLFDFVCYYMKLVLYFIGGCFKLCIFQNVNML